MGWERKAAGANFSSQLHQYGSWIGDKGAAGAALKAKLSAPQLSGGRLVQWSEINWPHMLYVIRCFTKKGTQDKMGSLVVITNQSGDATVFLTLSICANKKNKGYRLGIKHKHMLLKCLLSLLANSLTMLLLLT